MPAPDPVRVFARSIFVEARSNFKFEIRIDTPLCGVCLRTGRPAPPKEDAEALQVTTLAAPSKVMLHRGGEDTGLERLCNPNWGVFNNSINLECQCQFHIAHCGCWAKSLITASALVSSNSVALNE